MSLEWYDCIFCCHWRFYRNHFFYCIILVKFLFLLYIFGICNVLSRKWMMLGASKDIFSFSSSPFLTPTSHHISLIFKTRIELDFLTRTESFDINRPFNVRLKWMILFVCHQYNFFSRYNLNAIQLNFNINNKYRHFFRFIEVEILTMLMMNTMKLPHVHLKFWIINYQLIVLSIISIHLSLSLLVIQILYFWWDHRTCTNYVDTYHFTPWKRKF